MSCRIVLLCVGLCSASVPVRAENPPICADRPGNASATCTVPAGRAQIETGLADWSLERGGGDRETAVAIGQTILKYGLSKRSDVEVEVTPYARLSSRTDHEAGFGDVMLLYKHRLTSEDAGMQVALYPFLKLPTAKRPLGNRRVESGLVVPIQYSIGQSPFSVSLSPEIDWAADADGHGHHGAMAQVIGIGWQANDRLSLGGELWGQWDWDAGGTERQATVDASAAYLVRNDVQLDVGANFGLNQATADVEIYAGIAKRF